MQEWKTSRHMSFPSGAQNKTEGWTAGNLNKSTWIPTWSRTEEDLRCTCPTSGLHPVEISSSDEYLILVQMLRTESATETASSASRLLLCSHVVSDSDRICKLGHCTIYTTDRNNGAIRRHCAVLQFEVGGLLSHLLQNPGPCLPGE